MRTIVSWNILADALAITPLDDTTPMPSEHEPSDHVPISIVV
jgi:hypothetical protein